MTSCEKSNNNKIKESISTYLNENLDDMSSYEPIKYGHIDTILIFKGYVVKFQNPNKPRLVVYNNKGNLGFIDLNKNDVLVYNEKYFDVFRFKNQLGILDHKYLVFYLATSVKNKYTPKEYSLMNLKHNGKLINYSKLDSAKFEVLHTFRAKDHNGHKRIYKYYFRFDKNFNILDKNTNSLHSIDYSVLANKYLNYPELDTAMSIK